MSFEETVDEGRTDRWTTDKHQITIAHLSAMCSGELKISHTYTCTVQKKT